MPILLTTPFSKEQQVGGLQLAFLQKDHFLPASSLYHFMGESRYQEAHLFNAVPDPSSPLGMPTPSTTQRSQPNMHIHIRTDKMEPKESQDDSTGAKLTRGHILEKLDLVAAPSRAPKKVIAKAYDLTSIELFMLGDLAVPWARIDGDAKEESLTTEMLENFLKAVFKKWDGTNGTPNIPEKPAARNKREMSVQVGKRANDAPGSIANEKKQNQEASTSH